MKKTAVAAARRVSAPDRVPVSEMVESIVGCKWSLSVLAAIRGGVHRPGEIERVCTGISTKVLNERLRKMLRFGILERENFGEVPPRVEYRLTGLGRRFVRLIDDVDELQAAVEAGDFESGSARAVDHRKRW
jgi:DNA-binding HxlR family transcriptional regulator